MRFRVLYPPNPIQPPKPIEPPNPIPPPKPMDPPKISQDPSAVYLASTASAGYAAPQSGNPCPDNPVGTSYFQLGSILLALVVALITFLLSIWLPTLGRTERHDD